MDGSGVAAGPAEVCVVVVRHVDKVVCRTRKVILFFQRFRIDFETGYSFTISDRYVEKL